MAMSILGQRNRRAIGVLLAALLISAGLVGSAAAAPTNPIAVENHTAEITLMAVSDVHGTVLNWNYKAGVEYSGSGFGNDIRGLSRVSSLVEQVRAERGDEATLLFDVGDTLQGTPLMSYYTLREPITEGSTHPLALAMNIMEYDAMTVGNHEFNFGLPHLYEFERQLDAPLIAANVLHDGTDEPVFQPYVILTVNLEGHKPIRVGVLGLTPTGSAVWDAEHVGGIVEFADEIEMAHKYVPEMRAKGADVVVVAVHGHGTTIAEQVPGIDVLLAGHSHSLRAEEFVTNEVTGEQVLITQAGDRARYLAVADLTLYKEKGQWKVIDKSSYVLASGTVEDDPRVVDALSDHQATVIEYVNTPIGTTEVDLSLFESAYKDVPGMDLVNHVQALAIDEGMTGTAYDALPVLSIGTGIHRDPVIPPGEVSIADISDMYIFDNTLRGVVLTGAQIEDYLEYSAERLNGVSSAGPLTPDDVGGGGYCYDVIYGLTENVSYDIDLSEPEGDRIENLLYSGAPMSPTAEFVLAINNYRHNGGCGYPHVSSQPDVYPIPEDQIIQMIIEYFEDQLTIVDDPAIFSVDWQLTYDGTSITVIP
jgi:2',3'-cyclic-nucleotide 2'-phosphodiesterase/3'-nucleotidase